MKKLKLKLTKKNAIFMIIAAAALLAIIVLICSEPRSELETAEGRAEYLSKLGWEVDVSSETSQETVMPRTFDGVMKEYCDLQTQQGFKLERYAGMSCQIYCYSVTNYPNGDTNVIAQLIICEGSVIGGDIHSPALDGFMHGLK